MGCILFVSDNKALGRVTCPGRVAFGVLLFVQWMFNECLLEVSRCFYVRKFLEMDCGSDTCQWFREFFWEWRQEEPVEFL